MGHHHRCHSLLALAVHRLVLNCELADAVEAQTKESQLVTLAGTMSVVAISKSYAAFRKSMCYRLVRKSLVSRSTGSE